MADSYIQFPLDADGPTLADEALEQLSDAIPGWEPAAGELVTWMFEIMGNLVAQAITVGSTVPTSIFRAWGPLVGVPPIDATPATADTTWTAVDADGHTIPAGTLVGARVSADEIAAFEVDSDVVIPPGSTSTAAGAVRVTAVEAGAKASGLTGEMESLESLTWVQSITIDGATGGGVDAEEDGAYLTRLSRELELMSPRPVLPDDFAVLAARVAGVARATAVDGLDPSDDSLGNERMVAVAVIDSDGQPVTASVRDQVEDLLASMREVSFIVHVIDPSYEPINVMFTAVAHPGFDTADVQERAVEALTEYLSPDEWGMPPGDPGSNGGWRNEDTVRYFEVAAVLDRVDGLDYVTALEVNGGTVDVNFTDPITLPEPGTISGTVSAP